MHTDGTVTIRVNGEHKRVAAGLTLARLATELGLVPEKVAVERNLEVACNQEDAFLASHVVVACILEAFAPWVAEA